jgi:hypothetical protein
MSPEKLNFSCQNCHTTSEHSISGRYNDRKAFVDHELNMGRPERIGTNVSCESCHSAQPHEQRVIDNHSSKGTFVWGRNVVPQYRWYKGELGQMTYLSDIDPTAAPIDITPPTGSYADPDARIWPFKIHQGKQPFDTELNRMLPIKLYGRKGSGAFWTEFDWDKALAAGAKLNNIEFSGQYDFIETNGYWPIKHMVAPASDSVACIECHSQQSRLNGLNDFYLVGRDRTSWVEYFGVIAIWGGLLGIILHALTRLFMLRKRRANHNIKDDES